MPSAGSMVTPACVLSVCMSYFPFLLMLFLQICGALSMWHMRSSSEVTEVHSTPIICGACLP